MIKRGIALLLILSLLPFISANSVDDEIQKITYYAEEYETGNIDYVQLLLHTSATRERMNELLGVVSGEYGGILKEQQIKKVLGEPKDTTKWVWLEQENHEVKLDREVPFWDKIIFDGKKIQIRLNAYPSLFKKKWLNEIEGAETENVGEDRFLIYRLHFNIEFKRPTEQLDIKPMIANIKELAKTFSADPSRTNAEILAEKSVNAEKAFETNIREQSADCEEIMSNVFGSENRRASQKMLSQEITFYEGDNFDAIMKLEMCDDCEWNWINMHMWFDGRGRFNPPEEVNPEEGQREKYKGMSEDMLQSETIEIISKIQTSLEANELTQALNYQGELLRVTEAWNEKANNVWEQIEQEYTMNDYLEEEQRDPYYWIKQEQEKRQRANQLRKNNYQNRKQFYLALFSVYDKKEFYFEQIEWEKRLVEEFKESGKEICDNNLDDNDNEQMDCEEEQCAGKVCGKGQVTIIDENNETMESYQDLYCISGTCQAKEEIDEEETAVCGNHICESNETIENCVEDCSVCIEWNAIECGGKVIFKGEDTNGCPLEPVCIEENEFCDVDTDCSDQLCADVKCIRMEPEDEKGICKVEELKECGEAECVEGDEKIKKCSNGDELVTGMCEGGLWNELQVDCSLGEGVIEIEETEETVGVECEVKSDCGGENDVCSNGECVTIPEVIEEEEVEEPEETSESQEASESSGEEEVIEEETEEVSNEEEQAEESATGNVIFAFFRSIAGAITGATVDDENTDTSADSTTDDAPSESESDTSTEEDSGEEPPESDGGDSGCSDAGSPPETEDNCWYKETYDDNGCVSGYDIECGEWDESSSEGERDNSKDGDDGRERKENEEEHKENCERECSRQCVEECIRENCGEQMDCNIEEESKDCEGQCEPEDNCIESCMGDNPDWWKEFQEEKQRQEKGVFSVGGSCRVVQGREEGNLWFGGWGEPFEKIQPLKEKYYLGGHSDWCKWDLENLKKQRKEFEQGFNYEFVQWFFEDYLAGSAEDWEQHISGIYELYWRDVELSREMAHRLQCVDSKEVPVSEEDLISVEYETEYGKLEFWEELQTVSLPGIEGEVTLVSPYMKVWIFPPKSFLTYEMKQAMENHEFPGSPEEKVERQNQGGPTEKEKEMIRQDEKFMKNLIRIAEKYGGSFDASVQFKDYETGEVVFNLYAQANEEDIFLMEPMLPEEVPEKDATIDLNFDQIYEMIYDMEKDMEGQRIESPPWDRSVKPIQRIKEITNGIKMFFKIRKIMNSAEIYPESAAGDAEDLFNAFFKMMMFSDKGPGPGEDQGMDEEEMEKE